MSHPDLVTAHLDDEEVVASVTLSGEDELVVTPSRSLLYRAEGILSDESVTEYPHDVDTMDISVGRRKATIELTYPIEGTKKMSVPKAALDGVLHYLLAGILNVKGITKPGESVQSVFRFNELTVAITSERVVRNVGSSVWDEEFDEYRYEDLGGVEFEEGSVAMQIVLYVNGRSQRIKVPLGSAQEFKQDLEDAICAYFEIGSLAEFQPAVAPESTEADDGPDRSALDFGEVVEPLGERTVWDEGDSAAEPEEAAAEAMPASDRREVEMAIEEIQEALDAQREVLEAQQEALEELVAALTRDR